ncbi:hypothetical protein SAMN05444385_111116 [Tritonibacter mobilis]|nr:hypothetical protein SAMN05444385_111116 [Tritonibacter mobilis]
MQKVQIARDSDWRVNVASFDGNKIRDLPEKYTSKIYHESQDLIVI